MKELFFKLLINKYFIVLVVALIGISSNYFLHGDNAIEEISEEIIKEEIGVDIDLTPESHEEHVSNARFTNQI